MRDLVVDISEQEFVFVLPDYDPTVNSEVPPSGTVTPTPPSSGIQHVTNVAEIVAMRKEAERERERRRKKEPKKK